MDQGPLVGEQVKTGAEVVREFARAIPLQAAFWLKKYEDKDWTLCLASDQFNDASAMRGYEAVVRIFGGQMDPWVEMTQVRVTGTNDRLVQAVPDLWRKYPPAPKGLRVRPVMLGDVYAEDLYVYPLPVPVAV